ncbi:MAG: radical SAM protein [Clostridia bacterium]|nr:radical SAM protein [Clostridia bacterium]
MTFREKSERAAVGKAIDMLIGYMKKDPDANIGKLVDFAEKYVGSIFPSKNFEAMRKGAQDPDNIWVQLTKSIINETDKNIIRKMLLAFGLGAGVHGTKAVRANREKYKCNIPWLILMDPTSACNKNCKGCWSAEYGHNLNLTFDEMDNVVNQAKELGTHLFMFTGGEPLIKKKEILKLCTTHPDCVFLAFTNATLIDDEFCEAIKEAGNFVPVASIEGTEESNDDRRGEGSYQTTIEAMKLLKKHGIFFGMSVCYTSKNVEFVTSDEFIDKMISLGVKIGMYFNYMPVGKDAVPELIPSPDQRKHMYHWLRKMRNSKTGKPVFVFDFQDDGEYVGGCIAGGRNYFHINSAGDMEPCVFIHYSDSNIRTHTILEALKNPLFQAYYKGQPFNDNHLRPCPMLENPDCLRKIIKDTGAKSTDLIAPEDVDTLCSRCDKFAAAWKDEAEKLWNSTTHRETKTYYYRDTPEGKAELSKDK